MDPMLLALSQVSLIGDVECSEFAPHFLRKERCINCHDIFSRHREIAFKQPQHIYDAIFAIQKDKANVIFEHPRTNAKLFIGGFAACTPAFASNHQIRTIIDAANQNLKDMYPKWAKQFTDLQTVYPPINFLHCEWTDSEQQPLWKTAKFDQLEEVAKLACESLERGENVLIHCAQVKSRSGAASIATLMTLLPSRTIEVHLESIKQIRRIVEPNSGFMSQLEEFSTHPSLLELRRRYSVE